MATIRRSGSGWQALIRKKEYVGPKAKTFRSKAQAQLWANAVEGSLKRPEQLDQPPPQILKEAIDLFIEGPLQEHRSGHNEQSQALRKESKTGILKSDSCSFFYIFFL